MRISRKLFLLALTALAAMAFASPANAAVTVTNEVTGDPCGTVTLGAGHAVSGGCNVHIVGEQETRIVAGTPTGPVVISTCQDEFEAHIDSAGEGYFDVVNTQDMVGPACTREACDEAAPSHVTVPWRIHIRETVAGDFTNVAFCLRNEVSAEGTAGTPCTVDIPWTQTTVPHQQHFNATGGIGCSNLPAGAVTWFGRWHTEINSATHPEIVVSH